MAQVVDRLQHQPGIAEDHKHLPFTTIVAETLDHDHHARSSCQEDVPDHTQGTGHHHHHHADSGSGLPVPLAQGSPWLFEASCSWQQVADNHMTGFPTYGPERPPKDRAIRT